MRNTGVVAIGATLLFLLGVAGQGVAPLYYPANRPDESRITVAGNAVTPRALTEQERRGRDLYRREGCFHCHTQLVRPVGGEELRYGPPTQAGEYAGDPVPTPGVRRIGPDLSRIGGRVADGWHFAHLWDPRLASPDSVMPAYPWLFRTVTIPVDTMGQEKRLGLVPDAASAFFVPAEDAKTEVAPDEFGRWFLVDAEGRPALKVTGKPVLKLAGKPEDYKPTSVTVIAPTQDALDLVAYLQSRGRDLGAWQEDFLDVEGGASAPATAAALRHGADVYTRRCAGCHGVRGDGRGPAAIFLRSRPRPFAPVDAGGQPAAPALKFVSGPAGSLPTDADLHRTVTRGLRGTGMPAFGMMPQRDRAAVVQYVKSLTPSFAEYTLRTGKTATVAAAAAVRPVPDDPIRTDEDRAKAVALGEELYHGLACWTCHRAHTGPDRVKEFQAKLGKEAPWREGADQKAAPATPAPDGGWIVAPDFSTDPLKSGARAQNLYRVIANGIAGAEMAPMAGELDETQLWAVAHYVRSLALRREQQEKKP